MKKILLVLVAFFAFSGFALAAVDLNTATKEQLEAVKGIGPKKAQAIVDYRKKNGQFKSVDDLKNVKGFGDKTVAKLKNDLTIGGGAPKKEEVKKEDAKKDDAKKGVEPVKPAKPIETSKSTGIGKAEKK